MKKFSFYLLGTLLAIFGLVTLYLSGSVIFDLFEMRAKQGDYVMPVIYANFIASLLYLVVAYGFFKQKKWTTKLLGLAVLVLVIGGIGLFFYINSGGIYEAKTPKAMVFRISITLIFLFFSYFKLTKIQKVVVN
jgi:hypothetical protein